MDEIIINSGKIILGILVGITIGTFASQFFLPIKISKISKYILKKNKDDVSRKNTDSSDFDSDTTE